MFGKIEAPPRADWDRRDAPFFEPGGEGCILPAPDLSVQILHPFHFL